MRVLSMLLGSTRAIEMSETFYGDLQDHEFDFGQSQYQFNINVFEDESSKIKQDGLKFFNKPQEPQPWEQALQNLTNNNQTPIGPTSDFQILHKNNLTITTMKYDEEGKVLLHAFNPYTIVQQAFDKKNINSVLKGTLHANLTSFDKYRMIKRDLGQGDVIGMVDVIDPRGVPIGKNNPIIDDVAFEFGQVNSFVTSLTLDDAKVEGGRFSPDAAQVEKPQPQFDVRLEMAGLEVESAPFSFKFVDNKNRNNTFIHMDQSNFFMTDKYLQLDLQLPSQRIYGLGERNREFALTEGTWTMWSRTEQSSYDDGMGGKQSMGVHPFALIQSANPGEFFGVFFRNANAQSPVLKHKKEGPGKGGSTLSYVTTGGTLEIFFFIKGSAKQIIEQYQQLFGLPSLPPMWALGWHSSASAFKSLDDIAENVRMYKNQSLPLEGVWLDASYKDPAGEFAVNPSSFSNLSNFTKDIQSQGYRMVVTVDPTLDVSSRGPYYMRAQEQGALIMSTVNRDKFNGALASEVNKRQSVFLDFFNEKALKIWNEGLKSLFQQVNFDGLWLDTSELNAQCEGECPGYEPRELDSLYKKHPGVEPWYKITEDQSMISTYNMPFIPGGEPLDLMTLSLNATLADGKLSEYNVHSLHGIKMAEGTNNFLTKFKPNKRPFIMTKNTFAGSGKYSQHLLGETHRNWENMTNTIAGVMNFNMFGIPVTGPDTCGYYSQGTKTKETEELCARWIQLATYYPFARQHRDDSPDGAIEPYLMTSDLYKNWTRSAMQQRLTVARHFYTCLYKVSQDGGTCFDPLLFHFPEDDVTFNNIEHSFIYANTLKVTPVLDYETSKSFYIRSYFPKGEWVNFNDYNDIIKSKGGEDGWKDIKVPKGDSDLINAHIMPGTIMLKQEGTFNTTRDLNLTNNPIQLIINRDQNGYAAGLAYLDDGETATDKMGQDYEYYEFILSGNSIKKWNKDNGKFNSTRAQLEKLIITNAKDLENADYACLSTTDRKFIPLNFTYNKNMTTFEIFAFEKRKQPQNIDLWEVKDIHFGNQTNDVNHCSIESASYHLKKEHKFDLNAPQANLILESNSEVLPNLNMTLSVLKSGVFNIRWTYAGDSRPAPFEVPLEIVNPNKDELSQKKVVADILKINSPEKDTTFIVQNGATEIFTLKQMVLGKYFNYIDTIAHTADGSKGVMGLFGRATTNLFLEDGAYAGWSRDVPNQKNESLRFPAGNSYGNHPFYMGKDGAANWFGVYTNLVAAQDWYVKNEDFNGGNVYIQTLAAGGLGDIYIMMAATPNKVTKLYHSIVGKPVLTPKWALGWHQSRWGDAETSYLQNKVDQYKEHNLPLDVIWSDLDYQSDYKSFTYDLKHFGDLPKFIKDLHDQDMYYIPVLDAGIAQRDRADYAAYDTGLKQNVFLKNPDGSLFEGRLWANDAVFPDFFQENATSWWHSQLHRFHDEIPFDGLWLDMNEESQFCDGQCLQKKHTEQPIHTQLDYIPSGRSLESGSLPLDILHDRNGTKFLEFDTHSLYGTMEAKATSEFFTKTGKRPMIIERSASPGIGKFASHTVGDTFSDVASMAQSVTSIMADNIAGVPLSGSDICGTIYDTTPELCARWHFVGAFYPFSRNHNTVLTRAQEAYSFANEIYEGQTTYLDIMRKAMRVKYHLSTYYQSELTFLHEEGGAFYKPLFFEFPNDPRSYNDLNNNVMLGAGLKLGIQSNSTTQQRSEFYFPPGSWCDVFEPKNGCSKSSIGQIKELPSKADDFYLHIRGGFIVPLQNATLLNINTTAQLQKNPIDLHINPLCTVECQASGRFLNDDGKTNDTEGFTNVYTFNFNQNNADDDILININMTRMATRLQLGRENDDFHINQNDALGRIEIYNAKAHGINSNYKVTVGYHTWVQKPTISFQDAVYDPNFDRVIWTPGPDFWLPQLVSLTLTRTATK